MSIPGVKDKKVTSSGPGFSDKMQEQAALLQGKAALSQARQVPIDAARQTMEAMNAEVAKRAKPQFTPEQVFAGEAMRLDANNEGAIGNIFERRAVTSNNPMYGPVREMKASVEGAMGRVREGTEEQRDVEATIAAKYLDVATDTVAKVAAEADALEINEQKRMERLNAQQKSISDSQTALNQTVAKLQSAPPEDRGRYWANRTTFQKIMLTVSAMAMGALNKDPFAQIDSLVAQDIAEQRENHNKAVASVSAQNVAIDSERNVFASLLASGQDERSADLILQSARWKEVEAHLQQIASEHAYLAVNPQYEQLLGQVQEAHARTKLQLEQLAAANPRTRTTIQFVRSKEERALRSALVKQRDQRATEYAKGGIDVVQARVKATADMAAENAKANNAVAASIRSGLHALGGDKEFAAAARMLDMIDEYSAKYYEDVPGTTEWGVGGHALLPMRGFTEESRKELTMREAMREWWVTGVTGAHSSDEQRELADKLIGSPTLTEKAIRDGLSQLRREAESIMSTKFQAYGPEVEAAWRKVDPALINRDSDFAGMARPQLIDDEISTIPGATLEN